MEGEVVLITGGSSGIGLATANLFSSRGATVWLTSRSEAKLAAAASQLSHPVRTFAADVSDPESLRRLLSAVEESHGRLDVLINSAGQLELCGVEDSAAGAAERLIEVNYLGLARAVAASLPLLRNGTRRSIVNLSSFVGKLVPPYWSAYAASKHAVQAYSHALRQEMRVEGIHVGIVMPGPVASPMTQGVLKTPMYPLPFGVPVLPPDRIAEAILDCVLKRRVEVTVPRRFGPILRLAAAFPLLVDVFYRKIS